MNDAKVANVLFPDVSESEDAQAPKRTALSFVGSAWMLSTIPLVAKQNHYGYDSNST